MSDLDKFSALGDQLFDRIRRVRDSLDYMESQHGGNFEVEDLPRILKDGKNTYQGIVAFFYEYISGSDFEKDLRDYENLLMSSEIPDYQKPGSWKESLFAKIDKLPTYISNAKRNFERGGIKAAIRDLKVIEEITLKLVLFVDIVEEL